MDNKKEVKEAIAMHILPAEIVGDISKYGDMWRALVRVRPSGPLLLMEFHLTNTNVTGPKKV